MSNDWIEHNGGPQPVGNDTWVRRLKRKYPSEPFMSAPVRAGPYDRGWKDVVKYEVLNQHLIDAALKRGIELGLKAAEKAVSEAVLSFRSAATHPVLRRVEQAQADCVAEIRALNPDTIAKEAGQ